jgi:flagellar hook assembly protein FlgD
VVKVDARDHANHRITVPAELHAPTVVVPNVTAFAPAGPNPFRGSTTFALDLAQAARIGLELFSVDGRRVRTLLDRIYEPGRYTLTWDGHDDGGHAVAPGVYYVRFVAGAKRFTHSVVLLR